MNAASVAVAVDAGSHTALTVMVREPTCHSMFALPSMTTVASFIEGARFAFGVMSMVPITLWIMTVSDVLGDPLVLASWLKLG
jgi:hypothetical protein